MNASSRPVTDWRPIERLPADWQALWVSVRLALISTGLLLVICTPLAWWLARRRRPGQALLESVLALPLVLPPTVLGFYLLVWLGPDGPGGLLARLWGGHSLAFTFTGLVIGSVIYSLPFVLQPLKNAFAAIDRDTLDMAATLGAPPWDRFRNVVMPWPGPVICRRRCSASPTPWGIRRGADDRRQPGRRDPGGLRGPL